MRPTDAVTLTEAARILGVARSTVQEWIRNGRLTRYGGKLSQADLEQMVSVIYDWRAHLRDPTSYWVVGKDAAAVIGVSAARMRLLAAQDRLPYIEDVDGIKLYRRAQLEVLAWH